MGQVSRAASKLKFETGDTPSAADFIDLHDSAVWWEAGTTVLTAATTDYTSVLSDAGSIKPLDKVTVINATVPPNSSVAFLGGAQLIFRQINTGQATLVAGSGVTLNYPTGLSLNFRGQGSTVVATKRATAGDIWDVDGDLESSQYMIVCLASNATASTSTTVSKVTGFDKVVGAGTYTFKYVIIAQSATLTVSMKFAVNHTGTTTRFVYNLYFPSAGVTAATGAVSQAANTTTGQVWAFESTRTKNTTLGPMTDVDAINSDIMFIIEGVMVVTVSGTLEFYHGSETATSTQVMADSSLTLIKVR